MTARRERTPLEYGLMCLIARAPMTGSELVRLLNRYPLAGTGKSPGAVYPALYRLADAGLVWGRPRWGRTEQSWDQRARMWRAAAGGLPARDRRATVLEFGLTHAGLLRLRARVTRRVTRGDVLERPEHLMLRFALCTGLVGPTAARRLALQCRRVCRAIVDEVRYEMGEERGAVSTSARLAMACTLSLLEARIRWSHRAEMELAALAARAPELDTPSPAREVMVAVSRLPKRIRKLVRWPLRDRRKPRVQPERARPP